MKNPKQILFNGAALYAEAEKSDPFAYARAVAHIKSGVCSHSNLTGAPGYYEATKSEVDGRPVFSNVARP